MGSPLKSFFHVCACRFCFIQVMVILKNRKTRVRGKTSSQLLSWSFMVVHVRKRCWQSASHSVKSPLCFSLLLLFNKVIFSDSQLDVYPASSWAVTDDRSERSRKPKDRAQKMWGNEQWYNGNHFYYVRPFQNKIQRLDKLGEESSMRQGIECHHFSFFIFYILFSPGTHRIKYMSLLQSNCILCFFCFV